MKPTSSQQIRETIAKLKQFSKDQTLDGLKVKEAEQGELIRPGTIYVCPGSHHMRVSPTGRVSA